MNLQKSITAQLYQAAEVKSLLAEHCVPVIADMASVIARTLFSGGKILLCGNGGSASDSQHIAAEYVGRFRRERSPLPAIALTANGATLTAIGNDYAFDKLFERQVKALGKPGDVLIGLTTSGRSPNVLSAMRAARLMGLTTMGLTGETGVELEDVSDFCIRVPSKVTARIQECHLLISHIICEEVDELLFPAQNGVSAFQTAPLPKLTTVDELLTLRPIWRRLGKTVVWTNGCFDLFHVGHVRNLEAAKANGDILIVGVNNDTSVQTLKGAQRPIVRDVDRAELVAALACVDYVVLFSETDPAKVIAKLQPDVHCKGSDYSDGSKPIPEEEVVLAYGGTIKFVPVVTGYSTTGLIEKIRSNSN